jgi:hypothetical protein
MSDLHSHWGVFQEILGNLKHGRKKGELDEDVRKYASFAGKLACGSTSAKQKPLLTVFRRRLQKNE